MKQTVAQVVAALSPAQRETTNNPQDAAATQQAGTSSYATVVQANRSVRTSNTIPTAAADRKYNIVVYGINESPKGTHIHSRVSNDVKLVSTTIQSICPDVSEQSICDCTRLGKYSSERTRPVLVKLSRACDVHSILSSRHKLAHSESNNVSINPL